MKKFSSLILLALLPAPFALNADTPLGRPEDNRIYAQLLVNELKDANPDVILIGFHVVPPGATDEAMIACTHNLIGEKDDEGDLAAVAGQQTVLSVSLKEPNKFKAYLPLKDATGISIGLLTLNFRNEAGNDVTHYCARSLALRDGVAKRIPGLAALFEATPGAQDSAAKSRDSMDVQNARTNYVHTTGKKVTYTRHWDLGGLPAYVPATQVSGKLRIWGLNYLGDGDLAKFWEEGFRKFQPGVRFEYNLPTALIGIPGLVCGDADLAASRPVTFDERLLFQRIFDSDPLEIKMVTGSFDVPGWANAIAIMANKSNPISRLTLKQLDGILGAERTGGYEGTAWHPERARGPEGNIRAWGQLGLTGEWADKPINLYAPSMKFHIAPVIERVVFHGGTRWNERLHEYSNYAKPDGTLMLTSRQIMADLGKDPYGLAITGIQDLTVRTKAVALGAAEGGPFVELTIENVQNRTYPLIMGEYWYLVRKPGTILDPKLKEYLRFTLSREGQECVARDGKFLPLTAEVVREELKKLELAPANINTLL